MQTKNLNRCGRFALMLTFLAIAITVEAQPGPADKGEQKPNSHTIQQPGYLVPFEQVDVYARIMGYVSEVSVDLGDHVKKGQLLAKLAVPELKEQLEKKKAMVRRAEASMSQAKQAVLMLTAAFERSKAETEEAKTALARCQAVVARFRAERERTNKKPGGLFDKQVADEEANQIRAAEAGEDRAKAKVKAAEAAQNEAAARRDKGDSGIDLAQANVQVARADLAEVNALLQYAEIRAPFDGVLIRRNVGTGALAGPPTNAKSEPLFTLARVDRMRLVVDVPERDAVNATKGMAAAIRFDAIEGKVLKAAVSRTSGALDERARTLRIEIDLPNSDGKLLPHMYAYVTLTPKTAEVKKKE